MRSRIKWSQIKRDEPALPLLQSLPPKSAPIVHYCHCGKWGAFGYGVSLRKGEMGTWYCKEHKQK